MADANPIEIGSSCQLDAARRSRIPGKSINRFTQATIQRGVAQIRQKFLNWPAEKNGIAHPALLSLLPTAEDSQHRLKLHVPPPNPRLFPSPRARRDPLLRRPPAPRGSRKAVLISPRHLPVDCSSCANCLSRRRSSQRDLQTAGAATSRQDTKSPSLPSGRRVAHASSLRSLYGRTCALTSFRRPSSGRRAACLGSATRNGCPTILRVDSPGRDKFLLPPLIDATAPEAQQVPAPVVLDTARQSEPEQ
jgi:hypothetical protein